MCTLNGDTWKGERGTVHRPGAETKGVVRHGSERNTQVQSQTRLGSDRHPQGNGGRLPRDLDEGYLRRSRVFISGKGGTSTVGSRKVTRGRTGRKFKRQIVKTRNIKKKGGIGKV